MPYRFAINGFGRIGRAVLRAWHANPDLHDHLQPVVINDPAPLASLAHLLRYDSVHGRFQGEVTVDDDHLVIDGTTRLPITHHTTPNACPWANHQVDMVMECSGRFANRAGAHEHLASGAPRVLISAPAGTDVDATIVYGVNHDVLRAEHTVVSNASCTTNALAPLAAPLHEAFGIVDGLMTTVHAYTGDQRLVDAPHNDPYRSRAAALSIIPTKTGAAAAIGLVVPSLAGRLDGLALRVPTPNVSLVDLTVRFEQPTCIDALHACLEAAAQGPLAGVLATNHDPLVSIDVNHHPASSVVDFTQTRRCGDSFKLMAWYDNEWGFAHRMLDTAQAWMAA